MNIYVVSSIIFIFAGGFIVGHIRGEWKERSRIYRENAATRRREESCERS